MINIAMMCPKPEDATSFYRAWGPFQHLRKIMEINLVQHPIWTWVEISGMDVAFVQRPFQPNHLEAVQEFKRHKVPIWMDFDDDLLHIPYENKHHELYLKDVKTNAKCVELADVVTVSTETLKTVYSKYNPNVQVIKNGLDPIQMGTISQSWAGRSNTIMWRGGESHEGDLFSDMGNLLKFYKDFPKWKWVFFGHNPKFMTQQMMNIDPKRFIFEKGVDIFRMKDVFKRYLPKIMIFPLNDNGLNRSKSLNAWQDATWNGSLFVAPKWYANFPNCYEYLDQAIKDATTKNLDKKIKKASESLYTVTEANLLRSKLLQSLLHL